MKTEKRVLLVDDDKNVTETLKMILGTKYNTDIVHFGEAALGIILKQDYHVILLDINMPGLDGMEVLKGIKGRGMLSEIIMLTSEDNVQTAVKAMELGAFTYMTKPFKSEDLLEAVNRAYRACCKKRAVDGGHISRESVLRALRAHRGNQLKTAEELGVEIGTLAGKIREYLISPLEIGKV